MAKLKVPYFKWRDGRPRWEPGPGLRAKGFAGQDLKRDGQWLDKPAAIAAALSINEKLEKGEALPQSPSARTITALFAELRKSPKFKEEIGPIKGKGRRLADRTRDGYVRHLELVEPVIGDLIAADVSPAVMEGLYEELCETRGVAMANAIMRTVKMALYYGVNKLRWFSHNPVAGIELAELDGRTVRWTPEENATFIAAADWCGLPAIGDGHVLGLETAANRGDVIAFPELKLDEGVYRLKRAKTGRDFFIPPTERLESRLAVMRARKAERFPNVVFTHELVDFTTGAAFPAEGTRFTHQHEMVRAVASGLVFSIENAIRILGGNAPILRNLPFTPMPSIWGKRFQDLRDTAITEMFEAGCDIARIATITGHSLKTVQDIIDKHYFVRHAGLAIDAGKRLDAHRRKA